MKRIREAGLYSSGVHAGCRHSRPKKCSENESDGNVYSLVLERLQALMVIDMTPQSMFVSRLVPLSKINSIQIKDVK